MELPQFITTHREHILAFWEENARRRVLPGQDVSLVDLRDHLGELLETVARDLTSHHAESVAGNGGTARSAGDDVDAVAEKHGARRAAQGMNVKQVVAEFPLLRSCVARLWLASRSDATASDLEMLIRFDESIDRALGLSVSEFMGKLDESRETFLGILGHDLRDPLGTIIAGSKLMLEADLDSAQTRDVAGRIAATGERMHHLVVDLLDFTRTQLGGRMPMTRREGDLGEAIRHVVGEFATSNPDRALNLRVEGDCRGEWDEHRLSQAVANLVANALRHGTPGSAIDVSVIGEKEVTITVHNEGPPIPEAVRAHVFEPMGGGKGEGPAGRRPGHLGLGLYITKAIVAAHDGDIRVESSDEQGTTFTIHLPRTSFGSSS